VFTYDETVARGKGAPAGAGVSLFVDGKHLASTDVAGNPLVGGRL